MQFVLLTIALLLFYNSQAQLAKQANVTSKQLDDRYFKLYALGDSVGKDSIRSEALQLLYSGREDYMMHARVMYRGLADSISSKDVHEKLLKKYPKGIYVANSSLEELLDSYVDSQSFTKSFQSWSKRFKEALTKVEFADESYEKIVKMLLKNNAVDVAEGYGRYFTNVSSKAYFLYNLAQYAYDHADYQKSNELLNELVRTYPDEVGKDSRLQGSLSSLQAQVYGKQERWKDCLQILETNELKGYYPDLMFQALVGSDRYFDAFLLLQQHIAANELSPEHEKAGPLIFQKLGSSLEEWAAYKSGIEEMKLVRNQEKWKASMVDEESIDFELVDIQGKKVKASDYEGKIIVLDFWATWCVPCVMSFPGMQQAVNRYKDDRDVVFLFIDTWERDNDYKKKVDNLMLKKGYNFHILFDDMKRGNGLVDKYGVKGIPTKIFIDKKGRVRFNSPATSFTTRDTFDEVVYKIGLLKSENNKSI